MKYELLYNPFSAVNEFEKMIAKWAGSKYGVAVESCSAALFLSCLYYKVKDVWIPKYTYPSVPCSIIHAGGKVHFTDKKWCGVYQLKPYKIYDSALRFRRDMYQDGLYCLSFHTKKHLSLGRGGMILTNDKKAYNWLRRMRFDVRREMPLEDDVFDMLGWNMYMMPEQAIRGIQLFMTMSQKRLVDLDPMRQGYPDLSEYSIYQRYGTPFRLH